MLRPVRGPLGYVVAIVAVAVAIVLKLLMSAVGSTHPFVVLAAGVIVAAWLGGRGPGLLAVALAAIGSGFLFLAPGGFGADDLLAVAALIAENILIVEITVRLRAAQERAGAEAAEAQKARSVCRSSSRAVRTSRVAASPPIGPTGAPARRSASAAARVRAFASRSST